MYPHESPNRYERRQAGELGHIDVKKLGRIYGGAGHRATGRHAGHHRARGAGWSTSTSASMTPTVRRSPRRRGDTTAVPFLRRARLLAARGLTAQYLMTDNGAPYVSALQALACRALGSSACALRRRASRWRRASPVLRDIGRAQARDELGRVPSERHVGAGGF